MIPWADAYDKGGRTVRGQKELSLCGARAPSVRFIFNITPLFHNEVFFFQVQSSGSRLACTYGNSSYRSFLVDICSPAVSSHFDICYVRLQPRSCILNTQLRRNHYSLYKVILDLAVTDFPQPGYSSSLSSQTTAALLDVAICICIRPEERTVMGQM